LKTTDVVEGCALTASAASVALLWKRGGDGGGGLLLTCPWGASSNALVMAIFASLLPSCHSPGVFGGPCGIGCKPRGGSAEPDPTDVTERHGLGLTDGGGDFSRPRTSLNARRLVFRADGRLQSPLQIAPASHFCGDHQTTCEERQPTRPPKAASPACPCVRPLNLTGALRARAQAVLKSRIIF